MDDTNAILDIVRPFLGEWGINPQTIKLVSHSENIVYKVLADDNQQYALRVHRPGYHTLDELNAEQLWTSALYSYGISVPKVVRRANGEYYKAIEVKGAIRYVGMVEWLNGQVLYDKLEQSTNAKTLTSSFVELGIIMARTHNQASSWDVPTTFRRHHWNVEGFFGSSPHWGRFWEVPQLDAEQEAVVLAVKEFLVQRLSSYGERPETYSMIHADMHHGNVMVDEESMTVIDFDDAGFGWHLYDIAVAIYHYQDSDNFPTIQAAIIEGYRKKRELTVEDVELLPVFLLLRNVAILGWVHGRPELDHGDRIPSIVNSIRGYAELLGIGCA